MMFISAWFMKFSYNAPRPYDYALRIVCNYLDDFMYWILFVWIRYRNVCVLVACLCLITSTLNLVLNLINSIIFILCVQNLMASGRWGRPHMAPAQEDPTNFMGTMQEMAYAIWE